MHHPIVVLFGLIIAFAIVADALRSGRFALPYHARPLLSEIEREAYRRLTAALPSHWVFAQVQLQRFIRPNIGAHFSWRNRIAQLSADFVVCRADASVVAVIEIDDRTHERERQRMRDRKKDAACGAAGVPVIRWQAQRLPSAEQMRERLDEALAARS